MCWVIILPFGRKCLNIGKNVFNCLYYLWIKCEPMHFITFYTPVALWHKKGSSFELPLIFMTSTHAWAWRISTNYIFLLPFLIKYVVFLIFPCGKTGKQHIINIISLKICRITYHMTVFYQKLHRKPHTFTWLILIICRIRLCAIQLMLKTTYSQWFLLFSM